MGSPQTHRPTASVWFLTASLVLGGTSAGWAQETSSGPSGESTTIAAQSPPPTKPSFEVYGFAMLDMGHNFKQIDPNWFDTLRITRLPKVANEFGADNSTFAGVRQSRLGVKSTTPTTAGDLKTIFEFELFGTGVDEGQTTFRLRHAWGELGAFGAGQDLEPVQRPGRLSEHAGVLGPDGYSLVPQRAAPLHPDPQ